MIHQQIVEMTISHSENIGNDTVTRFDARLARIQIYGQMKLLTTAADEGVEHGRLDPERACTLLVRVVLSEIVE